jgi:wingless-type MMTV integration site family protein 4
LTKKQKLICKRNIEVMDSVRIGADKAVRECQYQFMERRWNCSTIDKKRIFGKILNEGLSFV